MSVLCPVYVIMFINDLLIHLSYSYSYMYNIFLWIFNEAECLENKLDKFAKH
jgi:hypothetical protein